MAATTEPPGQGGRRYGTESKARSRMAAAVSLLLAVLEMLQVMLSELWIIPGQGGLSQRLV